MTREEAVEVAFAAMMKQAVKTNADHIRSMSDEELAKFLDGFTGCYYCSEYETAPFVGPGICDCDGKCKRHLVGWLKQPYKEDT